MDFLKNVFLAYQFLLAQLHSLFSGTPLFFFFHVEFMVAKFSAFAFLQISLFCSDSISIV